MNMAVWKARRCEQHFVVGSLRPLFQTSSLRTALPTSSQTWPATRLSYQLLMILAAIAAFFTTAPRLHADTAVNVAKFVTPAEMRSGSLLLKSEGDRYVEAPLVATDADVVVSGPTARARITQIFHNPTDRWVEGIYVYPLSEGSAVDTLKMVIGERIVVADIENRNKARELYEQAKAAGQKTALMEQERP
ncbi:MAG: VIT domain-containing protein, partial [Xanthobacteraceae bacterium]